MENVGAASARLWLPVWWRPTHTCGNFHLPFSSHRTSIKQKKKMIKRESKCTWGLNDAFDLHFVGRSTSPTTLGGSATWGVALASRFDTSRNPSPDGSILIPFLSQYKYRNKFGLPNGATEKAKWSGNKAFQQKCDIRRNHPIFLTIDRTLTSKRSSLLKGCLRARSAGRSCW